MTNKAPRVQVDTAEFEGQLFPIGCLHAARYPQTDAYRSDIHGDDTLYLLCDECDEEGAQDI